MNEQRAWEEQKGSRYHHRRHNNHLKIIVVISLILIVSFWKSSHDLRQISSRPSNSINGGDLVFDDGNQHLLTPKNDTSSANGIDSKATVAKNQNKKDIKNQTVSDSVAPGNLYLCGWQHNGLATSLFPDYSYKGKYEANTRSHKSDILVVGMFGPCPISKSRLERGKNFRGIVLFVNGEPYGRIFDENTKDGSRKRNNKVHNKKKDNETTLPSSSSSSQIFQIGGPLPTPSWPNIYRLYFFNVVLMNSFQDQLELIFDPKQRPRGDAYYYLNSIGDKDENINITSHTSAMTIIPASTPATTATTSSSSSSTISELQLHTRMIYVASKCLPHRQQIAERLASAVPLDTGGKCSVTNARNVANTSELFPNNNHKHWKQNYKTYGKYKYCLTMENTNTLGYLSEKIVMGFLGGCLPVYWGSSEVLNIFNPNAFIHIGERNNRDNFTVGNKTNQQWLLHRHINQAIEQLRFLEENYTAYHEMLAQPILKNGNQTINEYFSLSDRIGDGSLKWKIRAMMGIE